MTRMLWKPKRMLRAGAVLAALALTAHLPAQAWEVRNLACSYDAATPGALTLTWDPYVFDTDNSKGPADRYEVSRYTFRGGLPPIGPGPTAGARTTRTSHVSTGLEDGVTYRFAVSAYRAIRGSPNSGRVSSYAIVYCVGGPQPSEEPFPARAWEVRNIACSYDAATPGALTLTWDPYVFDRGNAKGPTDHYSVERYTFRGGLPPKDPRATWAHPTTTRHVSTGLEDGVTYRFAVTALRAVRGRPNSHHISDAAIVYCVGGPESSEEACEPSASAGYAVAFPAGTRLRLVNLSDTDNEVEFEFRDQDGNDLLPLAAHTHALAAYETRILGEKDFGLDRTGNPTVTVWLNGTGFAVSAYTRSSGGLVFLPVHRIPPV